MIIRLAVNRNRVGILQECYKLHKKVSGGGRVEILFITKLFISTRKKTNKTTTTKKQLYYLLC